MLGSFRENRSCLERTSQKAKDETEDVFWGVEEIGSLEKEGGTGVDGGRY